MPIARTLNQNFFKTWTPEMAYVLGYFAADGCMIRNSRGGFYVEFTSTDRILLQNLQRVIKSSHRITERVHRNERWKVQYRIQMGSKEWYSDLLALGFTSRKSNTLAFPNVPEEYLGDFVRGYFDGDGCVYLKKLKYADRPHKRWVVLTLFTSGSTEFLIALHIRLKKQVVQKGSVAAKQKGAYELKFSHRDSLALYRIMYNTGHVSDLFLPRKREKLEKAMRLLHLTHAAVA